MACLEVQERREIPGSGGDNIMKTGNLVKRFIAGEDTQRLTAEIWTPGTGETRETEDDWGSINENRLLLEHYQTIYEALSKLLKNTRTKQADPTRKKT